MPPKAEKIKHYDYLFDNSCKRNENAAELESVWIMRVNVERGQNEMTSWLGV